MSTLKSDGRFAPCRFASCLQLAPYHAVSWPRAAIKRWLRCSVAPLGLLAVVSAGAPTPGMAQALAQAGKKPDDLPPVIVTTSQRKPARSANSATQRSQSRARVTGTARPSATAPVAGVGNGPQTPLNTNAVATSASRLGLTAREI